MWTAILSQRQQSLLADLKDLPEPSQEAAAGVLNIREENILPLVLFSTKDTV